MSKEKGIIAMTIEQHSQVIKDAMNKSIEGFIEVGARVTEAQTQLDGEGFASLFDKESSNYVGMAERQGYRFLSIAKGSKKLLQFQNDIPSDVTQLDAISRMTVKDIKSAIKADVMTPGMNRGDLTKWEKSLEEPEPIDPIKLDYNNPKEAEDIQKMEIKIEDVKYEEVVVTPLRAATKIVLNDTPTEDRIKVIKGLMKKWSISFTDLS